MRKFKVGVCWDVPRSGYIIVEAADATKAEGLVDTMINKREALEIVDSDGTVMEEQSPDDGGYDTYGDVEELPQ